MSVVKSKRSESELEFIYTARQLQMHSIRTITTMGKYYEKTLTTDPNAAPTGAAFEYTKRRMIT